MTAAFAFIHLWIGRWKRWRIILWCAFCQACSERAVLVLVILSLHQRACSFHRALCWHHSLLLAHMLRVSVTTGTICTGWKLPKAFWNLETPHKVPLSSRHSALLSYWKEISSNNGLEWQKTTQRIAQILQWALSSIGESTMPGGNIRCCPIIWGKLSLTAMICSYCKTWFTFFFSKDNHMKYSWLVLLCSCLANFQRFCWAWLWMQTCHSWPTARSSCFRGLCGIWSNSQCWEGEASLIISRPERVRQNLTT